MSNRGQKISEARKKILKALSKKQKQQKWPILRGLNGESNGHWKGGVHLRSDGYVLINMGPKKRKEKGARYKLLHRIVMENYLQRPLLRSEVVHHKNENRSDNRIQNLEIITQSQHATIHYEQRKINKKGQLI